jgi:hypothetical protein
MSKKLSGILITALIAIVAVAIVKRVPFLNNIVFGG